MPIEVGAGQKIDFLCNGKHYRQNIRSCCSCYFCIFYIFNFFQTLMISLFLAGHDHYLIMFKDSNVFEFTNFLRKTKYNNIETYSVNCNCLFSKRKQKTIVETIF